MAQHDPRAAAETVALQVLTWLAGTEDILGVFLNSSGLDAGDLKARIGDSEFLAAVLDFVLMDEAWVLAAAEFAEMPPDSLYRARMVLPGGDAPEWT